MDTPWLIGGAAVGSGLLGLFLGWALERLRLKRAKANAESRCKSKCARRQKKMSSESAKRPN